MIYISEKLCPKCRENKPAQLFQKSKYTKTGLSSWCKSCESIAKKEKYKKDPTVVINRNKKVYRELRNNIIKEYGSICACCGETDIETLQIDHIAGNGRHHVKSIGSFYYWLKRNNFPKKDFRLLCANCNYAKGIHRFCPHTEQPPIKEDNARNRYRQKLKKNVYDAYKNRCAKCGEQEQYFLQVHHKLGSGNKHRNSLTDFDAFYRELINNNYPADYELLCANCHQCLTRSDELPIS